MFLWRKLYFRYASNTFKSQWKHKGLNQWLVSWVSSHPHAWWVRFVPIKFILNPPKHIECRCRVQLLQSSDLLLLYQSSSYCKHIQNWFLHHWRYCQSLSFFCSMFSILKALQLPWAASPVFYYTPYISYNLSWVIPIFKSVTSLFHYSHGKLVIHHFCTADFYMLENC